VYTFIDESGNFAPPVRNLPHMCCVATLSVPDSRLPELLALHARLLADWNPPGGELKGRELTERNFRRIFTALMDLGPARLAMRGGRGSRVPPVPIMSGRISRAPRPVQRRSRRFAGPRRPQPIHLVRVVALS
jgi:hypothetical protein